MRVAATFENNLSTFLLCCSNETLNLDSSIPAIVGNAIQLEQSSLMC